MLSCSSSKSKCTISSTRVFGKNNTVNITSHYATIVQASFPSHDILWSIA